MQNLIQEINTLNENKGYNEALQLALKGIKETPDDYCLWIGKANALYGLGDFETAIQSYEKASNMNETDVIALSNLAGTFFELKDYAKGLNACEQGIERQSDYSTLYVHQGNCYSSLLQYDKAIISYEKALELEPNDNTILYNLAYALTMTNQTVKANQIYQDLIDKAPDDSEYLYAYASFLEQTEEYEKACKTYLKLLSLSPLDTTHITLGGCLYTLLLTEKNDIVLDLLDKWLTDFPKNPIALHFLETIKQSDSLTRASAEYVSTLFDAFADSFDEVLAGLNYQAPNLIAKQVKELSTNIFENVLDLGVGTGLCGKAFNDIGIKTKVLTGVDLSKEMLNKAKNRNLYTKLEQADILSFLPKNQDSFDLIISADVLTYIGDLSDLFKATSQALKQNGLFVFSVTENTQESNTFAIEPSGRFMHGKDYLTTILNESGMKTLEIKTVELRQELAKPVMGLVISCKKI